MLDRADCADFGCHNSIRLETKHFLNTLALTFISFSGRFVFAMQKHYLFFYERSSSLLFYPHCLAGRSTIKISGCISEIARYKISYLVGTLVLVGGVGVQCHDATLI